MRCAGRPIDLDDATHRQPADTKRDVETERARGACLDVLDRAFRAQLHDRTLAELAFDLRQCRVERLLLVCGFLVVHAQ
jgi:hypothetical protein